MPLRSLFPLALLAMAGTAGATTVVGNATLQDTATVINGTAWADCPTYGSDGFTPGQAMRGIDRHWLQFDPAIMMMVSSTPICAVIAIPAIDRGWTAGNTGSEFCESFDFGILGWASRRQQRHPGGGAASAS